MKRDFEIAPPLARDKSLMGICPLCGNRAPVTLKDKLKKHQRLSRSKYKYIVYVPCEYGRTSP